MLEKGGKVKETEIYPSFPTMKFFVGCPPTIEVNETNIEAEMEYFRINIEGPGDLQDFDEGYWDFVMAYEEGVFSLDEDLIDQDEDDINGLMVEEPEIPPSSVLEEDDPESYARSTFYFADVTFPASWLPYEEMDEFLEDIDPYGPFFRLLARDHFGPAIVWSTPIYIEELAELVITNLKKVYSPYVMEIMLEYEDKKDFRQYLITLVNLAGFRDHYIEPWMELLIPTISTARRIITPNQMRMANRLKTLFDLEEDPHNIEILWKDNFRTETTPELSRIVKKDVMQYGFPLVKMAITMSAGTTLKTDAIGYLEIYQKWLNLALARDWNKMGTEFPKLGLGHREVPWGIPEPTAELVLRYHNIKFGEDLDFSEIEKLNFIVASTSNESATHSMSKMPMNEFSLDKFAAYHYSSKSPEDFYNYLRKFEHIPLYCKQCNKPIIELEINYRSNHTFEECHKCQTPLTTHNYQDYWDDIETKYGIKIDDHEENLCDYCPSCGDHFVYRLENIPEYEDDDMDSQYLIEDFRENINYEYDDDYEWFENLPDIEP